MGVKLQEKNNGWPKAMVSQVIIEILDDPDFSLELTESAKMRLGEISRKGLKAKIPLSEIKKRYY